jgi:uncharacterized protein YndB with AHSA1/START domain
MSKTTFTVDRDKLQVRLSRTFNATRERVWQAMTDPDQIPQWWGPAKYTTVIEKHDLRVGGEWRFTQADTDGNEFAFHGEFKEIDEPNKCVQTFVFEGLPDADSHAITDTLTLTEVGDGRTRMDVVSQYQVIADLEGMVASGMESGAVEGYERLAKLVEAA